MRLDTRINLGLEATRLTGGIRVRFEVGSLKKDKRGDGTAQGLEQDTRAWKRGVTGNGHRL